MNNDSEKKDFNPKDVPQEEVFTRKEVFQHPQPADTGKPLREEGTDKPGNFKEREKTSNEDGLNEARSDANAGPFEGFENLGE